ATNEGDIVLDFAAGSGTTGATAHKMNRQYILVEQMNSQIATIIIDRLKNVIKGDPKGISKLVNWQGGGDFIYCELLKYNEAFMERIQAARSSKELLQIWQEMAEGSFLNWYVNPSMPEEAVNDFIAIGQEETLKVSETFRVSGGLEKQKRLLAELLDKNQLYVNLSEIDDAQFKVSEEDKVLNGAFYGE
ncbi:MAG: site-specific DNA-methyltransferase, partial [Anaerolineales bacterium]|nr:site-specific DNA-methyltransferase [Anaerolineales bacterium]